MWVQELPLPLQPTLEAMDKAGISTAAVADALLETQIAAALERIAQFMPENVP